MIAVLFEIYSSVGCEDEYLTIAADLRPLLDEIDGVISIERFRSLNDPTKILSLSFFRDEAAVERWRSLGMHRRAQVADRTNVFSDYRLRISGVIRDYGLRTKGAGIRR